MSSYAKWSHMTVDEVRAEFERWTFRMPGYSWTLDVTEGRGDWFEPQAILRITVETQDSYGVYGKDSGEKFSVIHAYRIGLYALTEGSFAEWLRQCISTTVLHEAMEWVRRDGVMLWNPHTTSR